MIGLKKFTILFAVILLIFNSNMAFADAAEKRATNKHRCSLKTDNRQIKAHKVVCLKSPSTNVSWVAWLTGDSRSNQFHYLDLLELLFRDKRGAKPPPTAYE